MKLHRGNVKTRNKIGRYFCRQVELNAYPKEGDVGRMKAHNCMGRVCKHAFPKLMSPRDSALQPARFASVRSHATLPLAAPHALVAASQSAVAAMQGMSVTIEMGVVWKEEEGEVGGCGACVGVG